MIGRCRPPASALPCWRSSWPPRRAPAPPPPAPGGGGGGPGGGAAAPPAPARAGGEEPRVPPAPVVPEGEKEWFHLRMAVFEPFERRVPRGAEARLQVTLKNNYRAPVLIVVFPDGAYAYVQPAGRSGRTFAFSFRPDARGGLHRVTLAADGPGGLEYAARFFLMALGADGKDVDRDLDLPARDTVYPPLDPEENPLRLERLLFHRMNALRRRQGLPVLPWLECAARAAREQLPDLARRWEETIDPRNDLGQLLHFIPGAGPGGSDGPTIADRVRLDMGWPLVHPSLPSGPPARGRNRRNFVTESLTIPDDSLDRKFEQDLLRKSDHRAAMLNADLTHAAGAACWRYYGWRRDPGTGPAPDATAPPGPPPAGKRRQVLAALVLVQVNDPVAEESLERERRSVRAELARASGPEERAAAFRLLGQHAFPDAPALLAARASDREPEAAAGAVDGLFLCDPGAAREAVDPLEVRVAQALDGAEEFRAAGALAILSKIRYDVATGRRAAAALAEVAKRGREALGAVEQRVAAGDREGARAACEAAVRRFEGFPCGGEARDALRALGPAPGGR